MRKLLAALAAAVRLPILLGLALALVLAFRPAAAPAQPASGSQGGSQSGQIWPTTPGAPPASGQDRKAKAERKGEELTVKITDDEALIRKYVRQGMGFADVREILGEPRGTASSSRAGNYICLGYGRIWIVFEDGQASCLRNRLEYVARYDSNCHCAGDVDTFIPFHQP